MKMNIGFIGCGKMAGAIIKGIASHRDCFVRGSEITIQAAKYAAERLGVEVFSDNKRLALISDIIFIATKPDQVDKVINEIAPCVERTGKLIVSIAAGVTTEKIESVLDDSRVIRVMPNTPAMIKLGMFGVCKGLLATNDDLKLIVKLLSTIGRCITVDESQMNIVTAISGSGPAFFYQIIEDMARAGEKLGLEYEKSLVLAAQTALGSAQMVFKRGENSVQSLIDHVATKGGCTYVGVTEMKVKDSAKFFYDVIGKTTRKAAKLGKS